MPFKTTRRFPIGTALSAFLVCLLLGPGETNARPLERHFRAENSCYERVYSKEHLNKHPGQRVRQIRFDHFPQTYGTEDASGNIRFGPKTAELYFVVSVSFRGSDQVFTDGGFCYPEGQMYRCQIECDGGGFYLKDRDGGSILLLNERGFYLSGCGSGGERFLDPKPDDAIFRLDRVSAKACIPPG